MSGRSLIYFACLISLVGITSAAKDLPSYFPKCHRNDPKLNDCLLKATEIVRPFLKKGVPELNIPSISPFVIPEISLEQGTSSVNYKAFLRNLTLEGLDNYQFEKFDFDVKNLRFMGAVTIPDLYMAGKYVVEGKILVAPIEGQGLFHTNITGSSGTLEQNAKLVTRKGHEYLVPHNTTVKIIVGDVKDYGMTGLFDGNESLGKILNKVVGDNLEYLVDDLKPTIEKIFRTIFEDLIDKSVARVDFENLYPLSDKY